MSIDVVIITYKTGKKIILPKTLALNTILADWELIESLSIAEYRDAVHI